MEIREKLKELEPYDLNCNVFDVYSYDGLSMQELLCQFFTKINECVKTSNETLDLCKWLVDEGLKIEVAKKLLLWLEDGTLAEIINVTVFNDLYSMIVNVINGNIYLNDYKNLIVDGVWTDALQQALNDAKGGVLYLPNEKIVIDKTIIIPSKTKIVGVSNNDVWDTSDTTGTIITTVGEGNPSIWTDIIDGDNKKITPLLVFGGNEISLENISFECNNNNRWDCAIFLPSVKRCELRNIYTYGSWIEAGLYLDATWSDKNEILKTLHPNIKPSSGMNELNVYNSYFRGKWGLLIQGTQRDTRNYNDEQFIWGYGGTSDLNFYGCRFGCDAPNDEKNLDGGCYKSDAAIKNGIGVGVGHNFFGCSFRTESKYLIYLNRSGRDNFISCYGETINHWLEGGNEHAQFFITGNTYQINRIADKIVAPVYRNSTKLSDVNEIPKYETNCRMTVLGIDGELNTGSIKDDGIYSSDKPLQIHSRYNQDGVLGNLQILNDKGIISDFRSDRFNLRDIPQLKSNKGFNINVNNENSMEFTTSTIVNYKHSIPNENNIIDCGTDSKRWRSVYSVNTNVLHGIRFNAVSSDSVSTRTLYLDSSDMQLKYKDHNGNIKPVTNQTI